MSRRRPVPNHFTRNGKPKVAYPSQEAAERKLTDMRRALERSHAYECPDCGSWHIGQDPERRRNKK